MMSRLISTEESSHAKRRNKRCCRISALLVALFTLAGVLTLSPAKAFATVTDSQIWTQNYGSRTWNQYLQYQSDVTAYDSLYNSTGSLFCNLYEIPFDIIMSQTFQDGSTVTPDRTDYWSGWNFFKVKFTFAHPVQVELLGSESHTDGASIYIESSSKNSTGSEWTFDVFLQYDAVFINRLTNHSGFTLLVRRTTSTVTDLCQISSVSFSDKTKQIKYTTEPAANSGLVESITTALNNAEDMDTIISVLNSIKSNTDLFTSVLSQLQSIGTDVAAIKQYLISGNAGTTVESAAAQQSAALSDYLDAEDALFNDAPAGPPQAQALGTTLDSFTESIQHSIYFWSNELYYFFDRLGLIWILLIVGLIIGLTGFLLRLRK